MSIPKFRAWITYGYTEEDLKNPDMAEEIQETGLGFMDTPDLIDLNNERIKYDCDWYDSDRFTLVQSTGLKDKNGKKIFEGDILHDKEKSIKFVVNARNGCFVADEIENRTYLWEVNSRTEVIGNIYENPELLEGVRQ